MSSLLPEVRAALHRPLEAATTLTAVHLHAASAEMILLATETAAGYFVGSQARVPSKASVLRFMEAYLPDLGRIAPGAVALSERPHEPVASCAEALYAAFRGGLLHDGERATGVRCLDDKGRWMLAVQPDGSLRLNVLPFHCQFERGMKHYLRDLERDPALAAKAEARSAFLAKPLLVPKS